MGGRGLDSRFSLLLGISWLLWGCPNPERPFHFDEEQIPPYTLPALLQTVEGKQIADTLAWQQHREHLLELYRDEVYGHVPGEIDSLSWWEYDEEVSSLPIPHLRKYYGITLWKSGRSQIMRALVYLPLATEQPVPVFMGYSFTTLPQIAPIGTSVSHDSLTAEPLTPERGEFTPSPNPPSNWPIEQILAQGFGVVIPDYNQIAPDVAGGFYRGVYGLFYEEGQIQPGLREWGALSAWAWGLSRIMDVLEEDETIDNERVAVIGHSRFGKTALWAAAQDQRFALAISNNSGCGGATLFRRAYGENIAEINRVFPHWFNDHFPIYDGRDQEVPVDQHQLLALIAPRPLYVASADRDQWADPRGEYLSTYYASPAWGLYGFPVWRDSVPPEVDVPRGLGPVGYHIRTGVHDMTRYDWGRYLEFAEEWL